MEEIRRIADVATTLSPAIPAIRRSCRLLIRRARGNSINDKWYQRQKKESVGHVTDAREGVRAWGKRRGITL